MLSQVQKKLRISGRWNGRSGECVVSLIGTAACTVDGQPNLELPPRWIGHWLCVFAVAELLLKATPRYARVSVVNMM